MKTQTNNKQASNSLATLRAELARHIGDWADNGMWLVEMPLFGDVQLEQNTRGDCVGDMVVTVYFMSSPRVNTFTRQALWKCLVAFECDAVDLVWPALGPEADNAVVPVESKTELYRTLQKDDLRRFFIGHDFVMFGLSEHVDTESATDSPNNVVHLRT